MNWNAPGWQPPGWQPPGWQPGEGGTPLEPQESELPAAAISVAPQAVSVQTGVLSEAPAADISVLPAAVIAEVPDVFVNPATAPTYRSTDLGALVRFYDGPTEPAETYQFSNGRRFFEDVL